MAIIGIHALMYSKKADETRAFLRDVLGFSSVDVGRGWLIFTAPPTELAVHPADAAEYHELYLMCDDVEATREELRKKGVATTPVHDEPWGRVTQITLPSGDQLGLYEPRHPLAIQREAPTT
jgi:catechol 2,3-dioxygenase-like lactoylglutathione lyase family enzyme